MSESGYIYPISHRQLVGIPGKFGGHIPYLSPKLWFVSPDPPLESSPGVAATTSATLTAYLPELVAPGSGLAIQHWDPAHRSGGTPGTTHDPSRSNVNRGVYSRRIRRREKRVGITYSSNCTMIVEERTATAHELTSTSEGRREY